MNGGDAHNALASFYDVPQVSLFGSNSSSAALLTDPPQISIRGPLLPALLRNHTLAAPWFLEDARHISLPLHAFLGRMVVAFLQDEQCRSSELVDDALMASDSLWPSSEILGLIPKVRSSPPFRLILRPTSITGSSRSRTTGTTATSTTPSALRCA